MKREKLIEIYEDTVSKSLTMDTDSVTTKHTFKDIETGNSPVGKVTVINSDTVSALVEYYKLGKTGVINMASFKRPGGGVAKGSVAQEECLFRCSTIHKDISTDLYPLKEDEALLTKDVMFFKDKYYQTMYPAFADVVTIAAFNLNKFGGNKAKTFENEPEYEQVMRDKIRLMLSLFKGCENIILGAWGCGVFKNDPERVANMFKGELKNNYNFKNVVFAVINDNNSVDNNYKIFKRVLGV